MGDSSSILYIAKQGLQKKKHCELILHDGLADDVVRKFEKASVVRLNLNIIS